jgi:hypothetical protein
MAASVVGPPTPHSFAHGLLADAKVGRHCYGPLTRSNAAGHQESTVGWCAHSCGCSSGPRLGC